jgi:hypothetical protein
MATVLIIDREYHTERHFTRGFRIGAIRSGWTPAVVWLRDEKDQPRPVDILAAEIASHRPDLILWVMDCVLTYAGCFENEAVRTVPKASFWFDDFTRAYAIQHHTDVHRHLCEERALKTYVWDGYWRRQFQQRFGVPCYPIHLAADEVEYYPGEPTHFKGFEDSLIFIGNVPSRTYILDWAGTFPQPCTRLIHDTAEIISRSAYGRIPYDALEEAYQALSPKMKTVVDHFRSDTAHDILLKRLAWMLAKREVRVRILRLAARQRPVAILSGHSDKSFARAEELSQDLGETPHPAKFIMTDHVPLNQVGCLYHIGGLHLQATDPQSVEGGIPFRVFETAASRRPLLSDFKPELTECFKPEEEILCYRDDQDFPDRLNEALKNPDRLKAVADAAYRRFLKEHTWRHRFQQIIPHSLKNAAGGEQEASSTDGAAPP